MIKDMGTIGHFSVDTWYAGGFISNGTSDSLQTWTEVRYYKKKQSDEVLGKSNDVTSRNVIFSSDVKMC